MPVQSEGRRRTAQVVAAEKPGYGDEMTRDEPVNDKKDEKRDNERQGDAAAGEKVFAHCAPCHSNKPGENKFGPSLAGVIGRKSGTEPGYNYSSAMKEANVIWDEKSLDEYLQGPGKFVRGTRMVYFVPNEKDRQDVIAYLKTLTK